MSKKQNTSDSRLSPQSSNESYLYAKTFKNAEIANNTEIPIENLNRKDSAPRRLWNAELKLSPPNAPPKLEPRCCKRIAPTRRIERIIWIYGSAGSTESIIFIPERIAEEGHLGK